MSQSEFPKPPGFADKLLAWVCKNDLFEAIQGDLHEYYERLDGPAWKNKLKYWYEVFNFLRPFAIKNLILFHNYFIIITRTNLTLSLRNIRKNFLFSLINIFGLGIALASCILISQYLISEWDYDKFHPDYEQTFRVTNTIDVKTNPISSALTDSWMALELKSSYPAVNTVCRIFQLKGNIMVDYNGKASREENIMVSDSSFFDLFNFSFIYGNKETALKNGNSVIITKQIAEKYFGDNDPIGKNLVIDGGIGMYTPQGYNDRFTFEVTGVLKNLPKNTHLDFDFLLSFNFYGNIEGELKNWGDSFYTYFQVNDLSAVQTVSAGLPKIAEKYRPDQDVIFDVQPMQSIHLYSNMVDEIKRNGNEKVTWLLAVIALIILGIAGTNYINFTLAKSFVRQKEIEIRKVFWAKKKHLIYQFLIEAFVINMFSLLLALAVIWTLTPILSALLDFDPLLFINSFRVIAILGGALLLATLLSGLYPALYLSGIGLSRIIGSGSGNSRMGLKIRNYLVAFQYTVSILVIGCAIVLYQQMKFIQNKDLGMDIDSRLVINGATFNQESDSIYNSKLAIFKSEALRLNIVENVTLSNFIPGKNIRGMADGYVRKVGDAEKQAKSYYFTQIDYDFIPVFGFKLIAGRNFDPSITTDRRSVVINAEACRLLGFKSPKEAIGQRIIYRMNSTPIIVGVIDNFHQNSVKRSYQPIILEVRESPETYCYLKVANTQSLSYIDDLEAIWKEVFPGNPFNFFYLDDFYARQYQDDNRFTNVFVVFSILAILIATLGIFGLTYYTAENKGKEIGIRKTLGAGIGDICFILSKKLGVSVLLATIVGVPLVYLIAERMLQEYAFRINVSWWMLVLPLLTLLAITMGIVSLLGSRTYKADSSSLLKED